MRTSMPTENITELARSELDSITDRTPVYHAAAASFKRAAIIFGFFQIRVPAALGKMNHGCTPMNADGENPCLPLHSEKPIFSEVVQR